MAPPSAAGGSGGGRGRHAGAGGVSRTERRTVGADGGEGRDGDREQESDGDEGAGAEGRGLFGAGGLSRLEGVGSRVWVYAAAACACVVSAAMVLYTTRCERCRGRAAPHAMIMEAGAPLAPHFLPDEWSSCKLLLILHVAKTGGSSLQRTIESTNVRSAEYLARGKYKSCKHADELVEFASGVPYGKRDGSEALARSEKQRVAIVELPLERVRAAGFTRAMAEDTCLVVSSIRPPHDWMESATRHAAKAPPWNHEYFVDTRNFQTHFLSGIEDAGFRSLSVVAFDSLPAFELSLHMHLSRMHGVPVTGFKVVKANVHGHKADFILEAEDQLAVYVREQEPLDLELSALVDRLTAASDRPFLHYSLAAGETLPEELMEVVDRYKIEGPTKSLREYLDQETSSQFIALSAKARADIGPRITNPCKWDS